MISNHLENYLLFIEPTQPASAIPLIDELTRKMAAAFRAATPSADSWLGVHECVCGVASMNHNYILPDGRTTHSLCVHYLAYHRPEVGAEQLQEVAQLGAGKLDPTERELNGIPIIDVRKLPPDEQCAWREQLRAEMEAQAAEPNPHATIDALIREFGETTPKDPASGNAQAAKPSLSDPAAIDAFIRATTPKGPNAGDAQ